MCLIHLCIRMLSCSVKDRGAVVANIVLLVANVVFLFSGLGLVCLGLFSLLLQRTLGLLLVAVDLSAAPIVVAGCLVVAVSSFGCCSASRQLRGLFIVYATCIVALLASQGYLVTMKWDKNQVQNLTETWVRDTFNQPAMRESFQLLEYVMECCGPYGSSSYTTLKLELPPTCCKDPAQSPGLGGQPTCFSNTYHGCAPVVSQHLQTLADLADGLFVFIIAVEILALTASLYLIRFLSEKEPQYSPVGNVFVLDDPTRIEMEEVQLITSQPEHQKSF